MIQNSTQSDDFSSYMILRGKQKKETRIQSYSPFLMAGTIKDTVVLFSEKDFLYRKLYLKNTLR